MDDFIQLNYDIFSGKAGKKVLFQPRIGCWLDDKMFCHEELPGIYKGCDDVGLYRKLNVSNRIYEYCAAFDRIYDSSIRIREEQISPLDKKRTITTPVGEIYSITTASQGSPGTYYSKRLAETEEDIRVAKYVEEGSDWKYNPDSFERIHKKWGEIGAPTMFICRTNIQECFVESMGVENTVFALADDEKLMESYFRVIDENRERQIREIIKSPIRIVNYGDNLHCAITPPRLFEKYVLPTYLRRRELFAGTGKFLHSHWDGDVKSLLKYATKCGLDGIEAMTPFPQGDVSVEEIRDAVGDKLVVLDGIAAILFNETYPVSMLVEQVEKLIEYFAGRLILGISDEMPSQGKIERVELVRDLVNQYNKTCG